MNQTFDKISAEDWHHNQNNITIPKAKMNEFVLNFFIVEGYRDAAIEFSKEAGIQLSNKELDKMIERIEIKKNILNGEIDSALQKVSMSNNKQILFKLKMQKLIELIKVNELDQAVSYAQNQIIGFLKDQPHLIDEIEKAMSLLAYKDLSKCPLNHLTQNSQRIKVASEVNQQLFQDSQGNEQAKITILMKILQWAQEILNSKLQYPHLIEISKGQFSKEQ
ncbi:unnamed protein product [Paramecium octaurelia]|uniref:CTLH domain-containing protein n=1 Tax=Paramecium octaurelia TaxID=43137 RepID=A0A8S1RX33_PAROT|nr:unnamed protein product [Paramecium octaurelia]